MRKRFLVLLVTAATMSCTRPASGPADMPRLKETQFIAVMAELQMAQARNRPAILQKHHVTEADLRDFVEKYSTVPVRLSAMFDSVQARVDNAREKD